MLFLLTAYFYSRKRLQKYEIILIWQNISSQSKEKVYLCILLTAQFAAY